MKHPKFRVRPHQPYWTPLVAMCDFAGDAELQAMRHCRRWASAPLLLGWSFSCSDSSFKLFFPRILYKTLILHLKLLKLTLYWSLHFKLWPFFWSHLFKYWLLPQSLLFKFNSIIGLFFSISCFSFKVWTLDPDLIHISSYASALICVLLLSGILLTSSWISACLNWREFFIRFPVCSQKLSILKYFPCHVLWLNSFN